MYHKTSHSYIIVIKFNSINISLFSITLHYSSFETLFLLHLIMHGTNIKLFAYFKKFPNIFPVSCHLKKKKIILKIWKICEKIRWCTYVMTITYRIGKCKWFFISFQKWKKCLIFHSFSMYTRVLTGKLVYFLLFHNVAVHRGAHLQLTHIHLNLC
jgi:hypothetical protein